MPACIPASASCAGDDGLQIAFTPPRMTPSWRIDDRRDSARFYCFRPGHHRRASCIAVHPGRKQGLVTASKLIGPLGSPRK